VSLTTRPEELRKQEFLEFPIHKTHDLKGALIMKNYRSKKVINQ